MSLILSGTDGLSDVDGTAATPAIRGTDANTGIFFPAADTIAFSEGGVESMRIDSSGNLGIGTSSPRSVAGYTTLSLNNTSGALFDMSAAGTRIASIGVDGAGLNIASITSIPMSFFTNNTERMRIDSSGGLILVGSTAQKATGTTWSNPSDQRLKDNIRDYAKGTTELMQVRVREWEYNGKGGTTEGMKGLGVIADEVMVVLPDTVENYEAKLNADDEETTAIKKFDATEITWLLVKALQELKTEFDQYKAAHP